MKKKSVIPAKAGIHLHSLQKSSTDVPVCEEIDNGYLKMYNERVSFPRKRESIFIHFKKVAQTFPNVTRISIKNIRNVIPAKAGIQYL